MKKQPVTTLIPNLTNHSEVDLLQDVADILLQPGPITSEQRKVLDAINQEFVRRESLALHTNRIAG